MCLRSMDARPWRGARRWIAEPCASSKAPNPEPSIPYPSVSVDCRYAGYGDTQGLERSVGVEFRAQPSPCVALVFGGVSAEVHCAVADYRAVLDPSQVLSNLRWLDAGQVAGHLPVEGLQGNNITK